MPRINDAMTRRWGGGGWELRDAGNAHDGKAKKGLLNFRNVRHGRYGLTVENEDIWFGEVAERVMVRGRTWRSERSHLYGGRSRIAAAFHRRCRTHAH